MKATSILMLLICVGCGQKRLAVHLNKITTIDTVSTTKSYDLIDDYFNVKLSSVTQPTGKYYIAKRENSISTNPFQFEQIVIVDELGKTTHFTDATEFLNFMSARGYEMASETKSKYGGDYTFKKKAE